MKENKFFIIPFLAVILVSFIFLMAQIPTAKIEPKHLPIALVNEDTGEIGATITEKLIENAPDAVKFIEYDSVEIMKEAMNQRETYGGLVVPENFSAQLASLQSNAPEAAIVEIYVNEGYNASVATTVETMLQKMATQLGSTMSAQTIAKLTEVQTSLQQQFADNPQLAAAVSPVQPQLIPLLATPITTETYKVNPVNGLASVPMGLFTSIWISSLLGAVLFYFAGRKRNFSSMKQARLFQMAQSLLPIVYNFFAGYVITLVSTWVLGYEFESFNSVALMLSIAFLGYVYLVLACLKWIGIAVVPIFAILMFFGLPLIQLAPEMLPSFYRDYVVSWLPFGFLIEGLKDILFFSDDVLNSNSTVLIVIAIIAFVLIWVKNLMEKHEISEN
ncbi:YhgE/Pip domain-containing protein [Solibacillus daqui]|uniref:YhgE/Pip domain-containing protein n=1 Tax=Solibacillus daqui TaxID=2912187 RepID=UPI002365F415|nr:ABC transporter permease [Solibacillus daqui]